MKPFQVISESEEYRDRDRFSVIRANLKTPEDKETSWTYIRFRDFVIIVALDDDKKIIVKKEWRVNRKDFVWELPSGLVEDKAAGKEDMFETANRELQEEAGLRAGKFKLLGSFYMSNHIDTKIHIVLAGDLRESKLQGDEHEFVVWKEFR